nr:tRNA (cytosine(34)-C(5))-methyltransferase-like [Ipomoea batatas]
MAIKCMATHGRNWDVFPPISVLVLTSFASPLNCVYFLFIQADNHKELASQPEKLNSSDYIQIEKSTAEIKEASKGLEAKSANTESVQNLQIPEGTKDTDILDNEIDDPTFNNKSGKTSQGNEADDVQPSTYTSASPEAEMVGRKRKLQIQGKWRGVDPVIFFREDEVINKIKNFYGIKESLPFDGHLITRNSDINHVKRIYYISKSVKKVLELNFITGQQLKIASVGLKISERHTSKDSVSAPCAYRITSEGLPLLLPHVTKQILYASPIDFKHLLQYKSIKFADFVDADFGEKASNLLLGYCVVVLDKDKQVAIGCWKGRANISVMVSSLDCQELLERMPMYMEEDTALSLHENKPSFVKEEDQIGDNTETKANSEVLEQTGT